MFPPFSFVKNKWINWRHGVGVSDDVTSTKAIRRIDDKMFCVLILLCQQVTHNKTICKEKTCLIIVTAVNMTSKRAFLQKVTVLLTSTTKTGGFA